MPVVTFEVSMTDSCIRLEEIVEIFRIRFQVVRRKQNV